MNFYKIREELINGKNINDIPLKVTFYARVSTETDEQLNSLDNQIYYFENYIKSNSNWKYIPGYIDEGISGSSVKKRKKFLEMINDSKKGYFDLILTKEVSRFSRNLADSIKYTQLLISNNVAVYFLTNGINTYDPNSEFILNMMGSVAQEEVKRLSGRVKWGHKNAIKRGRILGSNRITGYKKDNAKLVIVPSESQIVEEIFKLYATGNYGFNKLALELEKKGILNSNGNIYDKDTLKRIIKNPKYKGYYRGHTTEVIDYKTKKRIAIPIEEQIIYKDKKIPAIVSEELWNKANDILNSRSNLMKKNKGNAKYISFKYSYTSKLFCYDHNCPYQRTTSSNTKKNKWSCSKYIKYGKKGCSSPIILEEDLDNIFRYILTKIFNNHEKVIEEMLTYYLKIKLPCNNISKIKKEISNLNLKKEKILELYIQNNLTNQEFQLRNDKYNKEISLIQNQITELETRNKKIDSNTLKTFIKKELSFQNNLKDILSIFLDKVIIEKINDNRHNLKLTIYMNLENKNISNINYNQDNIHLLFNDYLTSIYSKKNKENTFHFSVFSL